MYITGNISTEELVDKTGIYSSPPPRTAIAHRVSEETGIPVSGLYVYHVSDKEIQLRINNNDSFDLIWDDVYWEQVNDSGVVTSSGYNHEIVSLDFTPEDSKNYLYFSVSQDEFDADDVDEVRIDVELKTSDLEGLVNYNGRINIPARTPDGLAKIGFRFVGGKASKAISTTKAGNWIIPAGKNTTGYKLENKVEFNSVL